MDVPGQVFFTKGVGTHREKLASFELALRDARIACYNPVRVASIVPPDGEEVPLVGLEADYRRSLTERDRQRKDVEAAVGQLEAASAELIRLIRLDPRIVVAPVEPPRRSSAWSGTDARSTS